MLVILIGALGGMMSGGLIGLFLGPVLLATAYQIFMDWMGDSEGKATKEEAHKETHGTNIEAKDVTGIDS